MSQNRIYMDYNATTPLDPEVIQAITDALHDAWGNPSSTYTAGVKAKAIISESRQNVARMVGGKAEDIIFTSGGTEANNMVIYSAVEYFKRSCDAAEHNTDYSSGRPGLPHFVTSNVEHDSIKLVLEHLQREGMADVTFVPVSKVTGRVEVANVLSALRPNTCLVSIMLANNETGVIMPIKELFGTIRDKINQPPRRRILLHTDAAQALGKIKVEAPSLGVDYLTIVGHKFYAPRIGALYVNSEDKAPLYPMLFGGGQERNFRPGTENTPMIAGLGKAADLVSSNLAEYESHMRIVKLYLEDRLKHIFGKKLNFNNHFEGSEVLPNTCNVSILGPKLQGWKVLSRCECLLASVGAACHSDRGDRPSHILLNCGVPKSVAVNALRISVGRGTTQEDVDAVVEDLRKVVELLEQMD
ncbi:selenocysteine lyase [Periophthalmus magnuspinnatus]|uniref:selenocysteine lyase n=1 Tax=Periophthalmus magnuspinnatus TaxID=409849 RepID=UPI00145BA0C7|nr:selenocysteine lyase [Periophthalmus magnuspinnatus]XP_055077291.1 selenocysteine lyase [Periophthalmus magnuspinnatus]XP_055077292.1 selenocysteine lyase [Periophthalmus magnuspinnatus]